MTTKKTNSGWNYRVVAEYCRGCWSFTIRDVYYKNNEPTGWGAKPQHPIAEDTNGLNLDLHRMGLAYNRPLLIIYKNKLVEYPKKSPISITPKHLEKYTK